MTKALKHKTKVRRRRRRRRRHRRHHHHHHHHHHGWLGGIVVRSRTSDSEVAGSIPTKTVAE